VNGRECRRNKARERRENGAGERLRKELRNRAKNRALISSKDRTRVRAGQLGYQTRDIAIHQTGILLGI